MKITTKKFKIIEELQNNRPLKMNPPKNVTIFVFQRSLFYFYAPADYQN